MSAGLTQCKLHLLHWTVATSEATTRLSDYLCLHDTCSKSCMHHIPARLDYRAITWCSVCVGRLNTVNKVTPPARRRVLPLGRRQLNVHSSTIQPCIHGCEPYRLHTRRHSSPTYVNAPASNALLIPHPHPLSLSPSLTDWSLMICTSLQLLNHP